MGVRSFLIGVLIAAGVLWSFEYGSTPGATDSGAFRTAAVTAMDPSNQEVADAVRIAIQERRPSWELYIADVDYGSTVLRVALRARPDDAKVVEMAHALVGLVRSPDARILWSIETVKLIDDLGVSVTQLRV